MGGYATFPRVDDLELDVLRLDEYEAEARPRGRAFVRVMVGSLLLLAGASIFAGRGHLGAAAVPSALDVVTVEQVGQVKAAAQVAAQFQAPAAAAGDCQLSPWSVWSQCSVTCGSGQMSRMRIIMAPASAGGKSCATFQTAQTQVCGSKVPCALGCQVGEWTSWGSCSKTCGGGKTKQYRAVIRQPVAGGDPCPKTQRTTTCGVGPCENDCLVSPWQDVGQCSAPCGGGTLKRSRSVLRAAGPGGTPCGALAGSVDCNIQPCSGGGNGQENDFVTKLYHMVEGLSVQMNTTEHNVERLEQEYQKMSHMMSPL